jgi:small subunit ribosomal protein S6
LQRSAFGRLNMTLPAPTYDLVVLLDPQADDTTREKLVADTRASIEAQGELLRHDDWGERALTYPIDRKTSAQYHLLQFHVADVELLSGLDRTLRLADEVLRFRIIKLAPGVPVAPDMSSGTAAARPPDGAAEPTPDAAPVPAESASEPAPAAEAEAEPEQAEPQPEPADAEVAVGEPS